MQKDIWTQYLKTHQEFNLNPLETLNSQETKYDQVFFVKIEDTILI